MPEVLEPTSSNGMASASPDSVVAPSKANIEPAVQYGGAGIRLCANIIDQLIVVAACLVMATLVVVGSAAVEAADGVRPGYYAADKLAYFLIVALFIVYDIGLPPTAGATIGKLILGYHIVGTNGLPVGFGRSIVRFLGRIPSVLVVDLGYIWILFDHKSQGWHDKIAGTYVVRKDSVHGSAWTGIGVLAVMVTTLVFVAMALILTTGPRPVRATSVPRVSTPTAQSQPPPLAINSPAVPEPTLNPILNAEYDICCTGGNGLYIRAEPCDWTTPGNRIQPAFPERTRLVGLGEVIACPASAARPDCPSLSWVSVKSPRGFGYAPLCFLRPVD